MLGAAKSQVSQTILLVEIKWLVRYSLYHVGVPTNPLRPLNPFSGTPSVNFQKTDSASPHHLPLSTVYMQLKYLQIMEVPRHLTVIDATIHLAQLCEAVKKSRIRPGQKMYAIDYMKMHAGKFVKQRDLLLYCDGRRREDSGGKDKNYSDNSRQVELLRNNVLPLEWDQVYVDGELWYRYDPSIKDRYADEVVAQNADKGKTFSSELKKSKLKEANYACEITGIPLRESKDLNADHFIPREKGGLSTSDNCVIINSHLNTSKNKKMPIEWFCESLLTNFMKICKRLGLLDEAKAKLKKFIDEF
jgi:5-methylcytosine-specific restriction endonuclease McrA